MNVRHSERAGRLASAGCASAGALSIALPMAPPIAMAIALSIALLAAPPRAGAAALRAAADPAAPPPLILEHLTTANGLPQSTVMTTLQDSRGFIWLGTQDGLIRYDGDQLIRYAYTPGARRGLPGNYIYQIAEDQSHDLWVAIKDAGLARWNHATDDFTVYRHDPRNPASLASDAVHAVLVDSRNRVWIGMSDGGVDVLDPRTGRLRHWRHDPHAPDSLLDDRVFTLALARGAGGAMDGVWVGTASGLDRCDATSNRCVHVLRAMPGRQPVGGYEVSSVLDDGSGELWVGTDGGLRRLERSGRVVQAFHHDARRPDSLSSDDVRALLEDRAGHLWVGTADGLNLLDRHTGTFSHYRHEPSDADSLRDSFILSLYEDDTGLVWIGTLAGGVSRWDPRSWEFGARRPDWLDGQQVTAFADAAGRSVWIASVGAGLVRFDPDSGRASDLDALVHRRDALGESRVMSLLTDSHGALWIGTMTHGLHELSAAGRLRAIPVRPGDAHGSSAAGIMTLFESRDGRIWIGTHGGGLNILDPSTGVIRQLPFRSAANGAGGIAGVVSAAGVRAIAEDSHGDVWLGTDGGGLDLARADGTVVHVYRHDPNDPATLPANTIYALAVDARDRLWIGTDGGGLAVADVAGVARDADAAIRFRTYSRADGLTSDTIYGVLFDASGRLWMSGNAGLMRFDPDTGTVKTFHREDGLQGEEFDYGAAARLRDGRLCFGGAGGFNIFDPARLTDPRPPPRPVLTQVQVLGAPLTGGAPTWLRDRLTLGYRANLVSLDFGVLDYSAPQRNRIAYRLSGLTDRWIDLGTQRRITLTNLDAGDHTLEVRAANSDSVWGPSLRLTIHRDPAPWRSRPAYAAYLLATLGLLAAAIARQRTKFRRVLRERAHLEQQVAARTQELLLSNQQLAEALQVKSRFLDRMSHELRTPMHGVVGMTELLACTPLSATQARLTRTIRSSARVLLQTVSDLLDLSKINAGKVQLEELPIDIGQILEECADLFLGQTQGIELITCPPPRATPGLMGDPVRLRQILVNLVANAVKFTEQGEVVVRADVEPAAPGGVTALFSVADTGIGMDAATIARIFEPFTQADESTTRRFGGTGLGLAICRELAQLMGGSIRVESRPQLGSTFHLSIPLRLADACAGAPPGLPAPLPGLPAPLPVALPPACARILTRRPALAESLARHLSALGIRVVQDAAVDAAAGSAAARAADAAAALLIIDADSVPDALAATQAAAGTGATSARVIVASAAVAEQEGLQALAPRVVCKPVHREALCAALAAALGPAAGPRAGAAELAGHVLLVEDEPVNAAVAQGYLAKLGCTCVWVQSGAQAVARSAAERFDLMLMDLSMPDMDGFATTALIRQRDGAERHTPIIALTAHDSGHYRSSCLAAGMDDLLSKPYTLQQCEQLLRRWMSSAAGIEALCALDLATVERLQALRSAGQMNLYSRVVELFQSGSVQALAQLRGALERADLPAAAAVCHRLASSAGNVGALGFARDLRQLERLCRAGQARGTQALYERLAAACPALIEQLLRLRLENA